VSLRARLTAAFAVAMAVTLTALGTFIYLRQAGELLNGIDRSLGARADALTAAVTLVPTTPLGGGRRFVDEDEAFAQVLDADGLIVDSTPAIAATPLLTPREAAAIAAPTFLTRAPTQDDDGNRLLDVPIRAGERPGLVVVGETLGDRRDALRQLLALYAIAGPAGLVLASAAAWALAGAALRPVERIRSRAAEMSLIDPWARLPVPANGDELTRLANTLNDLLARLHGAVEREHRFVDDASHELRTPLAILKAELDLALSRPRTAAELHATVTSAAFETDRLVQLSEDLLVLARARQGRLPLRRTPSHLPTLLDEAVDPLRGPAARAQRRITTLAPDQTLPLDRTRVRQAVQNLVENALRHGRGTVTVTATPQTDGLTIDVHDHGPGFSDPQLTTAFEPFARSQSRPPSGEPDGRTTDEGPGASLGLAIVKAVAEAHGGTVTADNHPRGGARVRLHLRT
jgi:signal transduction histidine kinase